MSNILTDPYLLATAWMEPRRTAESITDEPWVHRKSLTSGHGPPASGEMEITSDFWSVRMLDILSNILSHIPDVQHFHQMSNILGKCPTFWRWLINVSGGVTIEISLRKLFRRIWQQPDSILNENYKILLWRTLPNYHQLPTRRMLDIYVQHFVPHPKCSTFSLNAIVQHFV